MCLIWNTRWEGREDKRSSESNIYVNTIPIWILFLLIRLLFGFPEMCLDVYSHEYVDIYQRWYVPNSISTNISLISINIDRLDIHINQHWYVSKIYQVDMSEILSTRISFEYLSTLIQLLILFMWINFSVYQYWYVSNFYSHWYDSKL